MKIHDWNCEHRFFASPVEVQKMPASRAQEQVKICCVWGFLRIGCLEYVWEWWFQFEFLYWNRCIYIYYIVNIYQMYIFIYIYIYTFIYLFLIDIEKTEDMCTVHDYMFVNTFYHICHLLGTSDWVSEWDCQLRNAQVYCTFLDHVFVQCITLYNICIYCVVYLHVYIYTYTYIVTYIYVICVFCKSFGNVCTTAHVMKCF